MPFDAKLYKFRLNISNILLTRKTHSHKYLNLGETVCNFVFHVSDSSLPGFEFLML